MNSLSYEARLQARDTMGVVKGIVRLSHIGLRRLCNCLCLAGASDSAQSGFELVCCRELLHNRTRTTYHGYAMIHTHLLAITTLMFEKFATNTDGIRVLCNGPLIQVFLNARIRWRPVMGRTYFWIFTHTPNQNIFTHTLTYTHSHTHTLKAHQACLEIHRSQLYNT
ncbi:hypothetical protein T492DRAFT_1069878 [Pavlovales sp. CCMP2436]|nr:hypothetical protein T492DRAFT_1069878 [Pavlovales sp. CCMP2436]